jgi:toxin ParE1/3/4
MRIAWSEPAIADLVAIHDYIARDSKHYAERFIERLVAAVEPLGNFPNLGRVVPEGDDRHRELLFRAYRLIYRMADQEILIVAVVHGSRDLGGADEKPWDRP